MRKTVEWRQTITPETLRFPDKLRKDRILSKLRFGGSTETNYRKATQNTLAYPWIRNRTPTSIVSQNTQ